MHIVATIKNGDGVNLLVGMKIFGAMALETSVELQLVMVYLSLFLVSDHQASLDMPFSPLEFLQSTPAFCGT